MYMTATELINTGAPIPNLDLFAYMMILYTFYLWYTVNYDTIFPNKSKYWKFHVYNFLMITIISIETIILHPQEFINLFK